MIYSLFRISEIRGMGKVSRIHVIWNPIAGNGGGARTFSLLDARIRELGISYSQAESMYAGHAVDDSSLCGSSGITRGPRRNQT